MNTYTIQNDTLRQVQVFDDQKNLLSSRAYTPAEIADADARAALTTAEVNKDALLAKAAAAIAGNITFLADTTVTTAEAVTQVQRLTRQLNVLLKIAVNDLQNQNGT